MEGALYFFRSETNLRFANYGQSRCWNTESFGTVFSVISVTS